jgi:predicted NodU family carbamoyl transferase
MITLAISASGHDASIALLCGDEVATAFSCERTSREKHTGKIQQCDIDVIAKSYTKDVDHLIIVNASQGEQSATLNLIANAGIKFKKLTVDNDNHHLFHAAASYYPLGIDSAICIVVDGAGSVVVNDGVGELCEVTSFFYAKDTIQTLYKKFFYKSRKEITKLGYTPQQLNKIKQGFDYPVDLTTHIDTGQMYGTVTRYIGFTTMEAGKTMGLSAYGSSNNLPPILIPNTLLTNNNLFTACRRIDFEANPELLGYSDSTNKNMAYNVQRALEEMFVDKVTKALKLASSDNIILSGGCALNILGNSKVKRAFSQYNIYAEPIGTDSAQSLGAAYFYYKKMNPKIKIRSTNHLYYGPTKPPSRSQIETLIREYNGSNL